MSKAVMFHFINCLGCPFVIFNENNSCGCNHPDYEEDEPKKIGDDIDELFGVDEELTKPYFPEFCLLKDGDVINYPPVGATVRVKEIE